jgi:heavy metal translocating P-type ATPase
VLGAQRQYLTASAMVALVSLGEYLRELTRQHSLRALTSLYEQDVPFVWLVAEGRKQRAPLDRIRPGDQIVLYPGDTASLDGVVCRGEALLDQRILTGESTPVHKRVGDEVYAGSALSDGRIYVRAQRVGQDTRAAEIVRLVQSAPVGETRSLNYASAFADRLVPWSLGGAAALAAAGASAQTCVSLLIADFGTGVRVAGPTTVLAAMTSAARHGVLIKGGRQLERLAQVDAVVFDKTGTLTTGVPEISEVIPYADTSPDELLALAASAEQRFTHPAAVAVVRAALERGLPLSRREDTQYRIGQGVSARIGGIPVVIGSPRFLAEQGVGIARARGELRRAEREAASQLLVALDGRLAGVLLYRDEPREDAAAAVRALREQGVAHITMLTGDRARVAERVARQLGIDRAIAGALPSRKAEVVEQLRAAGHTVAVVGDGINDSPALAAADVGISLVSAAELAQQTADVVLLRERLVDIARAIELSRTALARIERSWSINCSANCGAIALSLLGLSGPVLATAISNGAALLSALHGMEPLLREKAAPAPLAREPRGGLERTRGAPVGAPLSSRA